MDYSELLEKYNLLLGENRRLIKENDRLKAQIGIAERKPDENRIAGQTAEKSIHDDEPTDNALFSDINNRSDSISKIRLFMSLFKGRDDVYSKKRVDSPKIRCHGSKNSLVWQHQSSELWQRRPRKHHAH